MEDVRTAVLYARVSTREQGESGLGLAAQRERLRAEADRRGWRATEVEDAGISGSTPAADRPALGPALASLDRGDVLVVAKLDRLSRSTLDFSRLLEAAERDGWAIVVLDLGVDTTTPNGALVAHVLMAVAQWERRMIAERTREGLAQSGKRLGRPPGLPAVGGGAPTPIPDRVRRAVSDRLAAGDSPARIAGWMNDYEIPSLRGGRWHRESVRRLIARLDAEAMPA